MARYTAAMINVRPLIQQRIKTNVLAAKDVAGASSLSDALAGRLSHNGICIFPVAEQAGKNTLVNRVSQRNEEHFGLLFAVHNVKDPRGADAADQCFELRAAAREELLGWEPHSSYEMLEKVSGKLIVKVNGFYLWLDVYKTASLIRSK